MTVSSVEAKEFADKLTDESPLIKVARRYRMARPRVEIPRMSIGTRLVKSEDGKDVRRETYPTFASVMLEAEDEVEYSLDDYKAAAKAVEGKIKKAVHDAFYHIERQGIKRPEIEDLHKFTCHVEFGHDEFATDPNNIVVGMHVKETDEEGELLPYEERKVAFDVTVQNPVYVYRVVRR